MRRAVASAFDMWSRALSPVTRKTLLGLMTDPDAEVRQRACRTVADGKDRDPALADSMAELLDDPIRQVRVVAVYGLARHDDERCVEGARRLPPAPPAAHMNTTSTRYGGTSCAETIADTRAGRSGSEEHQAPAADATALGAWRRVQTVTGTGSTPRALKGIRQSPMERRLRGPDRSC
ncbi:hypothetical protein [Streptomyces sp. NPDC003487]